MKKRLFSMFLALVMVLGLLPATALAAGDVAKIGDVGYASLDAAFSAAKNGDEVKILAAGTYALNTSGKNITVTGAVADVVFDNIGARNMGGANVTFNNVTFDYYPNVNYTGLQHSGNLVYNNCTINGQVFLYGASETFNNCTFNQNSAGAYNVWTYGAKAVEFNGCTFNSVGKSVLVYSEAASHFIDLDVVDCDFIASAPVDGKAAIEIDTSLTAGADINIDSATTATGFGTGNVSGNSLWNDKKDQEDAKVVVEGTQVWPIIPPELPKAKASMVEGGHDLTFALNFTIDISDMTEEEIAEVFEYYKDYFVDFELTFNKDVTLNADGTKDGYLAGQYDDWSENWVNVPLEDVTLTAGEPIMIMDYAAKISGQWGLRLRLYEIAAVVQDFDCGVYLTPEYMAANPDLEVKLELKLYKPAFQYDGNSDPDVCPYGEGIALGKYVFPRTYTVKFFKVDMKTAPFSHAMVKEGWSLADSGWKGASLLNKKNAGTKKNYHYTGNWYYLDADGKAQPFSADVKVTEDLVNSSGVMSVWPEFAVNPYVRFYKVGMTTAPTRHFQIEPGMSAAEAGQKNLPDINNPSISGSKTGYHPTYWYYLVDGVETEYTLDVVITKSIQVFPKFEANEYTVTFDAKGGEVDPTEITVTYDSAYGTLPVPTKTGYEFTGWTDESGAVVTAETVYKIAGDSTLTAVYNAKSYTVTLNADGGSVTPEKVTVIYDAKVGTLPTPEREGYKFLGWFDAEGNEVTAETVYTTDGDSELKAQWEKTVYNITVATVEHGTVVAKVNGVAATTATIGDVIEFEVVPAAGYELAKLNYYFELGAGGGLKAGETLTMRASDVKITPAFVAKTYTVTLNPDGGKVNPTEVTVTFDSAYGTLPVPTKKGYDFVGWFLDDTKIDATSVVAVADNHTLTAQWKKTVYTITVEATEGGTVEVAETATMKDYVALTITPNKGWKVVKAELKYFVDTSYTTQLLKADGSTAKGFMMPAANVTVVVEFEKIEYTITVETDGNGTVEVPATAFYGDKVSYTAVPNEFYRVKELKVSYQGDHGLVTTNLKDGTFFYMPAADVTITAVFEEDRYNITIADVEHGTVTTAEPTGIAGKRIEVTVTPDTGYELASLKMVYFSTSSNGNVTTELKTAPYKFWMPKADVTIYAEFAPIDYTVTFDVNGGDALDPATKVVTFDATYGELPVPTRRGYTFDGWFLGATKVEAGTQVKTAADHTLVAAWTANTYTLTCKSEPTNFEQSKTVTYDQPVGELPNPERTGYTFNGWFDAEGKQWTATSIVDFIDTKVLFADWTANKYTVTLDANGGEVAPTEITVIYDSAYSELPEPAKREGYTFIGWTLNGAEVNAATIVKTAANHTLVAQWEINKHTVTYDITGKWFADQDTVVENVVYATSVEAIAADKDGYVFSGWTTKDAYTVGGVTVAAGTKLPVTMPDQDITVVGSYKRDIANATLSAIADVTYTGSAHTPKLTVSFDNGTYVLVEGVDYELAYENNVNAGTAKVTITAKGDNYCGETGTTFVINPKSIEGAAVEIEYVEVVYDGTEKEPKVVSVTLTDGTVLAETDYVVSYANNVSGDKGVATVIVEGIGNYKDTASTTFEFLYTVTFVTEGVTTPAKQYVKYGQTATNPGDSVKFGSDFAGWYTEGRTKYDFNTPVTKPITLTAQFVFGPIGGLIVPPANNASVTVNGLNTVDHMAYIIGSGDGKVNPLGTITRAEVATIFFRLMNDDFRAKYWDNESSYADVAADAWYNVAVATLENAGIIKDTVTGGNFRPTDLITRAELAVMAAQFAVVSGEVPATTFVDVPATYWAAAEIAVVQYAGWIEGNNGMYRPDANLTRAECMTIVNRMLQRGAEAENMLADMTTFTDNAAGTWYYEAVQEATNSHTYNRTEAVLTGESFLGEKWVKMEAAPDWAALEKAWAEA